MNAATTEYLRRAATACIVELEVEIRSLQQRRLMLAWRKDQALTLLYKELNYYVQLLRAL